MKMLDPADLTYHYVKAQCVGTGELRGIVRYQGPPSDMLDKLNAFKQSVRGQHAVFVRNTTEGMWNDCVAFNLCDCYTLHKGCLDIYSKRKNDG